jgi:hypothetical protein
MEYYWPLHCGDWSWFYLSSYSLLWLIKLHLSFAFFLLYSVGTF